MQINLLNVLDFFNLRKELNKALEFNFAKFIKVILWNKYIFYVKAEDGTNMFWSTRRENSNEFMIDYIYMQDEFKKKIFGNSCSNQKFVCSTNDENNKLTSLGMVPISANKFLKINLSERIDFYLKSDKYFFEPLQRGNEEKRCEIQNDAFYSMERAPLKVKDVKYEMGRKCFLDSLAIFLKISEEYIAYGQIMLLDNKYTVANLCVKTEYQKKGYGKKLLDYLLHKAKELEIFEVYIKVKSDNEIANKLYENMGFKLIETTSFYEI
ncbi:MAG: GNAT family N-acetyltransferase [Sarcina sp.]